MDSSFIVMQTSYTLHYEQLFNNNDSYLLSFLYYLILDMRILYTLPSDTLFLPCIPLYMLPSEKLFKNNEHSFFLFLEPSSLPSLPFALLEYSSSVQDLHQNEELLLFSKNEIFNQAPGSY